MLEKAERIVARLTKGDNDELMRRMDLLSEPRFQNQIRGTIMDSKILNLGCGNENYGTHRVDVRATKTTTHVFDVEEGLPFPDGFFEEVYERNLFEHLQNPGFHLKEIYRVLRKGSRLVLITDNASCIRYYLLQTHMGGYRGHRRYFTHDEDKHYAIFTKEHLKNLLVKANFQIVKMEYVDTDFLPTFFIDKLIRVLHFFSYLTYPRIKVIAQK